MRKRVLIDVDGVVGDLMGGFCRYLYDRHGVVMSCDMITAYHIAQSPQLREIHERINLDHALSEYLRIEDVYQLYVDPIDGALECVSEIHGRADAAFLTATMTDAPQSYVSKFRWLHTLFGDIPMISCPSKQKPWVRADFLIEDRYDTVLEFEREGGTGLVIAQPWNNFPDRQRLDWYGVVRSIFG